MLSILSTNQIRLLLYSHSVMSNSLRPHDCPMLGFPVLHYIPELAQTHVHWFGDTIQPSHPLSPPSSPAFNLSQLQGLFQWVGSSHQVAKYYSFSFSISPSNIQGWFLFRLTGLMSLLSSGFSRVFSNTTVQKHQFLELSLLCGPTLTSRHYYWTNHSLPEAPFCTLFPLLVVCFEKWVIYGGAC